MLTRVMITMYGAALIENALKDLVSCPEGVFIVLKDSGSGKLVQIAGSRTEPLVLDLPVQQFTTDTRARAERVLGEYGKVTDSSDAIQLGLGRDLSSASQIVLRVFRDVFLIEHELQLRVLKENAFSSDAAEAICERCGEYSTGNHQLMLYPWWYLLFGEYSRRQWFCARCLRIMRVYAAVGFLLLAILLIGIVGVSIWLIGIV